MLREGLIVGINRIYFDVVAWGSAGVVDVVILADSLEVLVALDDINIWKSKQLGVRNIERVKYLWCQRATWATSRAFQSLPTSKGW